MEEPKEKRENYLESDQFLGFVVGFALEVLIVARDSFKRFGEVLLAVFMFWVKVRIPYSSLVYIQSVNCVYVYLYVKYVYGFLVFPSFTFVQSVAICVKFVYVIDSLYKCMIS